MFVVIILYLFYIVYIPNNKWWTFSCINNINNFNCFYLYNILNSKASIYRYHHAENFTMDSF